MSQVDNFKVKCGVRKTSNPRIVQLLKTLKNAEVVECDWNDAASLEAAMEGVDRVLTYCATAVATAWGANIGAVAKAGLAAGVKCLYWITGQSHVLEPDSLFVQLTQKAREQVIAVGLPVVEIRPP